MRLLKRIVWIVVGLFLGFCFGYLVAIGLLGIVLLNFGDSWKYKYYVSLFGLLLIVIFTIAGAWLGATSKRKRRKALLPLAPDLEVAARAHFYPSAPGDRSKQSD